MEILDRINTVTVWDIISKFENDYEQGIMQNYEWVAEGSTGRHVGPPWYDGLICEVIRGVSDLIAVYYNKELDDKMTYYADRIYAAQNAAEDGYINTYITLICPDNRWGDNGGSLVWQHEIYNLGCLIEAGIHYYLATGKEKLLVCAVKAADCMCAVMGEFPKKNIVPAHQLAEEAMIKLYRLFRENTEIKKKIAGEYDISVKEEEYLRLAIFWIEYRGRHEGRCSYPHYMGEYAQDHCPLNEQTEAVGHAVRAALYYTGITVAGIEAHKPSYIHTVKKLWDNVILTKLHVSGGIGAVHTDERFGYQYDLPNNAYLETCAGAAMCFWAGEMHRIYKDSSYMDVLERALYNNVLPCLSLDGKNYFYENPLISDGSIERWSWHECPCCPPMLLKLMGAMQDYIYSCDGDAVYINLLIGSKCEMEVHGLTLTVEQSECGIPWIGRDTIIIHTASQVRAKIKIRKPDWALFMRGEIGEQVFQSIGKDGYLLIERLWSDGDSIKLTVDVSACKIEAHPYVTENIGRIAIQRGPLLYCLEETDNPRGTDILLGSGEMIVTEKEIGEAKACCLRGYDAEGKEFLAIPYYLWNNRGKGTMNVWIRQESKDSDYILAEDIAADYAAHKTFGRIKKADMSGWDGKLYRKYGAFDKK